MKKLIIAAAIIIAIGAGFMLGKTWAIYNAVPSVVSDTQVDIAWGDNAHSYIIEGN